MPAPVTIIFGVLGVGLAERMVARELAVLGDEAGEVTPAGLDFLSELGVDLWRRGPNGECFAGHASTGPSGARISAARSARLWRNAASI